jgi:SAM-dependent methyltransferase
LPPDTSNADIATRYDAIDYAALPHPLTHPDRIATVATFLGMSPPAVANCRVLEVGCNDGANLIPMAVTLPDAHFVGCDLASRALDAGRRMIAELGLTNVTLVEEDLAALSPAHGTFDYIVAHGVYSWVPAHVRDALFALAARRLAPNGVMFVSFNALPGCRVRQATWDVLHFHVDGIADPRARLDAARQIARIIGEGGKTLHEADEAVRAEFRAIAQRTDSALFHDDLALPNDPFYFHEFAAHAARHGFQYLADAELHSMRAAGITDAQRAFLSTVDPVAREQYLDFMRLRRFRQLLLRRGDAPETPIMHPQRVGAMHVSADGSLLRAAAAGKVDDLARGLDPAQDGGGTIRALLDLLLQRSPAALPVADLREYAAIGTLPLPRPVEAILADAYVAGIVTLHVHPPRLVNVAAERPIASPLARLQARTQDGVTSLLHAHIRLPDPNARMLLAMLDGKTDRSALADKINGPAFGYDRKQANAFVLHALEQFARLALLAG